MKLFGWMNKFNGKQGNTKTNTFPPTHHLRKESSREEFSDWPHGLLAIGTFGNNAQNQNNESQTVERDQEAIEEDCTSSPEDLQDCTTEEIGKLQKELTKLLKKKPTSDEEKEIANLPLDRFLSCPSSLEISRRMSNSLVLEKEEEIERTISIILRRCKEVCESKKKSIGKKSISSLLKKMFVCSGGFAPQPSLRETFQESRMEKLLKTLLYKKINPQNPPRASSIKKYLKDKQRLEEEEEEEGRGGGGEGKPVKASDGSKWVKTDSEYIVLEI